MLHALAAFGEDLHLAAIAQAATHLLPEDHPDYEKSRKRANNAWLQILADARNRGVIAHPKKRWSEGEATFEIVLAPHPLRFAHFAEAARPGFAASTQYHTIQGPNPDYEELASSLTVREVSRLSSICTDRRYWLCDAMPNQVKPSTYRVGESHHYVLPIWDPTDGMAKCVAAEGYWRPAMGMGFTAHWVLELGAVNTDIIEAALLDARDHPEGERLIAAPWDLISLAEKHAFSWASQWAERLAMDDEHSFGVPPGETVETIGRRLKSKQTVTRTAYEEVERLQLERAPKAHVHRRPTGINPWRDPDPDWAPPSRSVRVTRVDPDALRAACESADREAAIADLMDNRTVYEPPRSAEPDESW